MMEQWGKALESSIEETDTEERLWTPRPWPSDPRNTGTMDTSEDETSLTNKILAKVGKTTNKALLRQEIRAEIAAHNEEVDHRRLKYVKRQIEVLTQERAYLEHKIQGQRDRIHK